VSGGSETFEAMSRAGRRVLYHLLRAGVEGLKAVEAIIEELGKVGEDEGDTDRQRIEVE
jgi:hypothetical protein